MFLDRFRPWLIALTAPPSSGPALGRERPGGSVDLDPSAPGVRLDDALVEGVAPLQVRARRAVEGLRSGAHRSPHRGASVVFAEHRDYRPGDNLRSLDWRAYARTDRFIIKHFEQEAHLSAQLVLDASASMAYGQGETRKAVYAGTLLAALGLILLRQGDSVGAARISDRVLDRCPSRARGDQLHALVALLDRSPDPQAHTDLNAALLGLTEQVPRRSFFAVASDLLEDASGDLAALSQLTARGHDVIVFHVLHRDELTLPFDGHARFRDPEADAELETDPAALRSHYRTRIDGFIEDRRRRCLGAGCRYVLAPTDDLPHRVLSRALKGTG